LGTKSGEKIKEFWSSAILGRRREVSKGVRSSVWRRVRGCGEQYNSDLRGGKNSRIIEGYIKLKLSMGRKLPCLVFEAV